MNPETGDLQADQAELIPQRAASNPGSGTYKGGERIVAQAFGRAIGLLRRGIGAAPVTKVVAWARERHGG